MRGLWTEETKELALEVIDGVPGAMVVIDKLLWFSDWCNMMLWCKDNLKGSQLWMKYKDEFNYDWDGLGKWIQEQIRKEEKRKEYHGMKIPLTEFEITKEDSDG